MRSAYVGPHPARASPAPVASARARRAFGRVRSSAGALPVSVSIRRRDPFVDEVLGAKRSRCHGSARSSGRSCSTPPEAVTTVALLLVDQHGSAAVPWRYATPPVESNAAASFQADRSTAGATSPASATAARTPADPPPSRQLLDLTVHLPQHLDYDLPPRIGEALRAVPPSVGPRQPPKAHTQNATQYPPAHMD